MVVVFACCVVGFSYFRSDADVELRPSLSVLQVHGVSPTAVCPKAFPSLRTTKMRIASSDTPLLFKLEGRVWWESACKYDHHRNKPVSHVPE